MNKAQAMKLAKSGKITRPQLRAMLKKAYDAGYCNKERSKLNPTLSRAACFNIMWKAFGEPSDEKPLIDYAVRNALVEFGDYGDFPKPPKKQENELPPIIHYPAIDIYMGQSYKEQK